MGVAVAVAVVQRERVCKCQVRHLGANGDQGDVPRGGGCRDMGDMGVAWRGGAGPLLESSVLGFTVNFIKLVHTIWTVLVEYRRATGCRNDGSAQRGAPTPRPSAQWPDAGKDQL